MSQSRTLARPYARAVFAVARDRGRLPEWAAQLEFAARAVAHPELRALVGHPRLDSEERVALIGPPSMEEAFADFLRLLAENGRLALLPEIADLFAELRSEAEAVVRARLVIASPAEEARVSVLRTALERRFGRRVELETAVDPELIGGVRVEAGDVVIDGSLCGKLARLRTALLH